MEVLLVVSGTQVDVLNAVMLQSLQPGGLNFRRRFQYRHTGITATWVQPGLHHARLSPLCPWALEAYVTLPKASSFIEKMRAAQQQLVLWTGWTSLLWLFQD